MAITDLDIKVMYSKTAQIVLVEDRVPPEALCLTWREPADLGSMCLPKESDLIKPRGPDAPTVPIKRVGEIFKASPMLRPRPVQGEVICLLATIAETEQPIVIEDDEDTTRSGASASSGPASAAATLQTTEEFFVEGTSNHPTKGPSQETSSHGDKGSTSCGEVCCAKGTSGAALQHFRLPNGTSRIGFCTSSSFISVDIGT